jgi:hypothetical protein
VQVASEVGAPCALTSVIVTAAGQTVRLTPAPPLDSDPTTVAELRLPPGDHPVAARASARCAAQTVVVEAGQVLRLDPGQAPVLTVSVSAPRGALAIRLGIQGAMLAPEQGVADRELVCAGVRSSRKALCRAEADLALAIARKNVAWALCVRDQLPELRAVADLVEAVQARADRHAEALAQARIDALADRVARCAGTAVPEAGQDLVVHQAP